jgi:hypothetical protein
MNARVVVDDNGKNIENAPGNAYTVFPGDSSLIHAFF